MTAPRIVSIRRPHAIGDVIRLGSFVMRNRYGRPQFFIRDSDQPIREYDRWIWHVLLQDLCDACLKRRIFAGSQSVQVIEGTRYVFSRIEGSWIVREAGATVRCDDSLYPLFCFTLGSALLKDDEKTNDERLSQGA